MQFYANENFPRPSVEALRALGHDVLTTAEAGNANQRVPDEDVVRYATNSDRIVLTLNRKDFIRIHRQDTRHTGIVVCHEDLDFDGLAQRIHTSVSGRTLASQLVQVPKR